MLLRPFPFPKLDRIVTVWETAPKQNDYQLSPAPANFRDWSEQSKEIEQLAAVRGWDANLTRRQRGRACRRFTGHRKLLLIAGNASATRPPHWAAPIFRTGLRLWWSSATDSGSSTWVPIPGIVGRQLLLNGQKFTVIGITSADFDFPTGSKVWTPLDLNGPAKEDRENHYLTVFGRLKDGVSISSGPGERGDDRRQPGQAISQKQCRPRSQGQEIPWKILPSDSRQFVLMLMGAAVFVLLLACANVANLQLARASGRQREIALRAALGASRWQVGRQLLVESVLLALLGSGMAILLSGWWLNIIRRTIPPFIVEHIAGLKHLQVDLRVFMFTVLIAVAYRNPRGPGAGVAFFTPRCE